jgi:glycosyltransferase involved in cell wall biosynthesis
VKSPFFTVIIPTFNRSDKLQLCLNSVFAQTFSNYEIVIIDNGSTDNTEKMILEKYRDFRIRYFWQEGSGSPANPRNQGILKARGDWVSFLDSDDVWYPEKMGSVYEKIQNEPETDVICHNERFCDQTNQNFHIISHIRIANDMYKSMLMEGNCLSPSATSIRKSFLTEKKLYFNESPDFAIVEDYDLWLRLAKNGAIISFINKTLADYVVDGGNMISDWDKYINNLEHLYNFHAFTVQNFEPSKEKVYNKLIAKTHLQRLKKALKEKKYLEMISELSQSLYKSPTLFPKKLFFKIIIALSSIIH